MNPLLNKKFYKVFLGVLFFLLFSYILLRIIFNEALHDEIATYMFYFYHGGFVGGNIHWDANNHLLNSFLGNLIYRVFGDNFALLRLPNLFAFVLYFFGSIRLTKGFTTVGLKFTSIVALSSIPFILEYFGNARGYGLSFGFFIWALVHLNNYLKTSRIKPLLYTYIFLVLAVSANLTFINSAFIFVGFAIISPLLKQENRTIGTKVKEWLLHFGFISCLTPFIYFGFLLKEKGALYYGSLDGLWEVTGKSLSKYVLFLDFDWLRFVFILIFIGFIVYLAQKLRKSTVSKWLQKPFLVYAGLFFGNIVGILLLAYLFGVNFPEDRTAMYLVILFLFMLFQIIDTIRIGKWLQVGLLFFPMSLLFNLSLHTSVFSPDDRMNKVFYKKVKEQISPKNSLAMYHLTKWTWPYMESHSSLKSSVGLVNVVNKPLTDIIISRTALSINPLIIELYDTIAIDEPSSYIAFKRKQPLLKKVLRNINCDKYMGEIEYYNFIKVDCSSWVDKNLQITIKGHLKTKAIKNKIHLVVSVFGKEEMNTRNDYYSFETSYQSQLIDNDFLHHFVLDSIRKDEKEIKVYLWNRGLDNFTISNATTDIFELKSPENELR